MNREDISAIISHIADRHIEEALGAEHENASGRKGTWKKIAAAVIIVLAGMTGIGTISFAANADFRNAVLRFISNFSEEERNEIREGHMTKNLSKEDTLIEFLHQLQEGKNLLKYGEDGFEYTFTEETGEEAKAVVACKNEKEYLLVVLKGSGIEKDVLAWKVDSSRTIPSEQAEKLLSGNERKESASDEEWTKEEEKKAQDSVITATGKKGKLYRAADKENIVILTEKETELLASVFDRYQEDEDEAWWGHGDSAEDYVILLPGQEFLVTKKGYVIRGEGAGAIAYILKENDRKKVVKLFEKQLQ